MDQVGESGMEWMRSTKVHFQYKDGAGDTSFRHTHFVQEKFDYAPATYIMSANECFAAVLIIICNLLVVIVFIRVLGLVRTASKVIVNMAAANFVVAIGLLVHARSSIDINLTNSATSCRLGYMFHVSILVLERGCMASALLERLMALNIPVYHGATFQTVLPIIILAPWVYWLLILAMAYIGFFQFDMGHSCAHHLLLEPLDTAVEMLQIFSDCLAGTFFISLVFSRLLHSPHSDNAWEVNRQKMEMKTAAIIGQVFALDMLLKIPHGILNVIAHSDTGLTYQSRYNVHYGQQLANYGGCLLFLVLLMRRGMRKAFLLILASSDTIRRSHQTNYLIAAATEGARQKRSTTFLSDEEVRISQQTEMIAREDPQAALEEWVR